MHVVEGVKAVKFSGAVGKMGGAGGEPCGDGAGCGVGGGQDFPDFWDELFAVAKGQHGGNKGGALYIGDGGAGAQGERQLGRGSGAGTWSVALRIPAQKLAGVGIYKRGNFVFLGKLLQT